MTETKNMQTKRKQAQDDILSLKDQLKELILKEIMSEKNKKNRADYKRTNIFDIEIDNPEATFAKIWKTSQVLLEE